MNAALMNAPKPTRGRLVWLARRMAALLAAMLAMHVFLLSTSLRVTAKTRQASENSQSFQLFIAGLWPQAQSRGVSRATFDAAFEGVSFDPKIVAHTKNQAEFVSRYGSISPARFRPRASSADRRRRTPSTPGS
jgi:membrane-bound lytic murein transglycosylase B